MPGMLTETFTKTVQEARERSRGSVGPGYYALHATGRFVTRRVLEAVVHGVDLSRCARSWQHRDARWDRHHGRHLDDLLARRTVAGAHTTSPTTWRGSVPRPPRPSPRPTPVAAHRVPRAVADGCGRLRPLAADPSNGGLCHLGPRSQSRPQTALPSLARWLRCRGEVVVVAYVRFQDADFGPWSALLRHMERAATELSTLLADDG